MTSSQNIVAFDSSGSLLYQHYYKAPGASLFSKVVSTVAIAAFNVASAVSAASIAQSTGYASYPIIVNNPTLSARYRASADALDFYYLYTSEPADTGREGFSLVQIDKSTGRELGRLWLDERRPDYLLDEIKRVVFFKADDREIVAFAFDSDPEGQ